MVQSLKQIFSYQILLTLFSPVLGVIHLFRSRNDQFTLWAGTFLFGILGSIYVYIPGNDGHTHLNKVKTYYVDMSMLDFFNKLADVIFFREAVPGVNDPYLHILAYVSGGVFGIPELLHVIASLIYGVVYFKSITFLLKKIDFKQLQFSIYLLLTVFFIYRGVTGLNSIRWWTAFWFMFLGVIGYACTERKKYIFFGFISIFIHFSFLAIGLPVFISYFFRKYKKLLLGVWIASFFIGASYKLIEPYVPEIDVITKKEKYVLDETVIANRKAAAIESNANFYTQFGEIIFRDYSIVLLTSLIFAFYKPINVGDRVFLLLFAGGVALYSFGNIFEFSPSVSGRAKAGASVLLMAAGIRFLGSIAQRRLSRSRQKMLVFLIFVFFLSCIPVILFQVSYLFNMFSVFSICFPIFSWFLGENDLTLREFLTFII